MPTVRYQIRNEYGLADAEVYRAACKDDPEALLEGVAMAGLVGLLRQLGDLAEFAAEVFHDLHEEVMATSARSHGLMLRVQQLEAEFPSIEKILLCQTDHSHCAYSASIDWHANLRLDQNLVTQGDMPRSILDLYEECRGPPRLFMLDRFDVAGAGTCLKRYSDPSFFKKDPAPEAMEVEIQREKTARKFKRKGSNWRSDNLTASFFTPIMDNSQHTISEHVPEKFPRRHARLKCRNLKVSDISTSKSYMEGLLEEEIVDQNGLRGSLSGSHSKASEDMVSNIEEVINDSGTNCSMLRKEIPSSLSPAEQDGTKLKDPKAEDKEILETVPVFAEVSQKPNPPSQNANERLVDLRNNLEGHNFVIASNENYMNPASLKQAEQNNLLADSGFITDDDHDVCVSDDFGSELENYVDALNTMESEIEIDSDSRVKLDRVILDCEFEGTNPDVNAHLELLTQGSESGLIGCYDTSVNSDKVMDEMLSLSQSTALDHLLYQQLQHRTAFDVIASSTINEGEIETLDNIVEGVESEPSASLASPEGFGQKKPSAAMFDIINGETSCSSSMIDSTLILKCHFEETQMHAAQSIEAFSGNKACTPKANGHVVSSSPPWKPNHIVVNPTYEKLPNMPSDVLEEVYPIEKTDDSASPTIRKKCDMHFDCSETEVGIVIEKAPLAECCNSSWLTLMDNEMEKPPEKLESETKDYHCGSLFPNTPIGSTTMKSIDMASTFEIDMQSEDLSKKFSSKYMVDDDEDTKELKSGLKLTAEASELHIQEVEGIASHGFTANLEIFNDKVVNGCEEIGSPPGSQYNTLNHHCSGVIHSELTSHFINQQGDTTTFMSTDISNTFQLPKPLETRSESSVVEVSEVLVKDSLPDLIEGNGICSSEKPSPTSSSFSGMLISSTLQFESLTTEVQSGAKEEFMHLESQGSFRNLVSVECEASSSPAISQEVEHMSDAEETLESANIGMMEPLRTDWGVNIDVTHELSESNETNDLNHVNSAVELDNESVLLNNEPRLVLLEESTKDNDSLMGKVITEDVVHETVHMLQCADVSSFNVQLQENMISEDHALYDPKQHIKESASTRDFISVLYLEKSNGQLSQDEDHEMLVNKISGQSSILDLSSSSADKLMGVNADYTNVCSRENEQHSCLDSEDVIHGNGMNGKVLSLPSSNVSTGDVQVQEDLVSQSASLNQHKLEIELSEFRDDSKSENDVTEEGTQFFLLPLSQSLQVSCCGMQLLEGPISEYVSLDQLKHKKEEPDKFENELPVPFCQMGDQEESAYVNASSLSADSDLSHLYDNNLIYFTEDARAHNSKAFVQAHAERPQVQSLRSSTLEEVDELSSLSLCRAEENIQLADIHDEGCSDSPTGIQNNSMLKEILLEPDPLHLLNLDCNNECGMPSSRTDGMEQTNVDPSDQLQGVYKRLGISIAFDTLAPGSPLTADFIDSTLQTSSQENPLAMPGELVSSFQQLEVVEEGPPLPPLPPLQWRMGKTQLGSLVTVVSITTSAMVTNASTFASNNGSVHVSSFSTLKGDIDQHASPYTSHALEDGIPHVSFSTDNQLTETIKFLDVSRVSTNLKQQTEIGSPEIKSVQASNLSLPVSSKEDVELSHSNIESDGGNAFANAMMPCDVMLQHRDLLEARNTLAKEQRPELAKLLSGLELERSQEASIIDRDTVPPLNSFIAMSNTGEGKYHYGYSDYAGYDGQSIQHHNFSASYPVAVHNLPSYSYHMFLREGNPSTMYDIMMPEMEFDKPYGKPSSIRNRPRDPLIEAVAAHDKSTLRKISELDLPLTKPKEHESNYLLEQIKNKSFSLKPATSAKPNIVKAPTTNLKVAAILEKANAIRQACVGSDEDDDDDDDDNWSDSGRP